MFTNHFVPLVRRSAYSMSALNYKSACLHFSTIATLILVVVLVLTTKTSPSLPLVNQPIQSEYAGYHVITNGLSSTNQNEGSVGRERVSRGKTWDWIEVFDFVPNGIRACQKLFENEKFLVEPFVNAYKTFEEETKKYGWLEGYSAMRMEQYLAYIKLVEAPFVRTVCETGFNAGHSALAWLEANPMTHVYSFDIGVHEYARPMADYLSRMYPGRINVTWGDSTQTLPWFHERWPDIRCDLLVVDGGHTKSICQSDFDVFYKMANVDNIVVLDNYPDSRLKWMTDLGNVWERAKRRGKLIEIFSCSYAPADPHGFSVGRFNIHE